MLDHKANFRSSGKHWSQSPDSKGGITVHFPSLTSPSQRWRQKKNREVLPGRAMQTCSPWRRRYQLSLKQADTSVKLQVPDQYSLFKHISNSWKPLKSKESLIKKKICNVQRPWENLKLNQGQFDLDSKTGLSLISLRLAHNWLSGCWQTGWL